MSEEDLIDYLGGELSAEHSARVEAAIREDPGLQKQVGELRRLMSGVMALPDPEPSAPADAQFSAMLAEAQRTREGQRKRPGRVRKLLFRLTAVAAAVLLAFVGGRLYENGGNTQRELAATRTLMLELMQDDRTSARIKATTVALEAYETNPQVISDLGYLLRNDENTNVRLAAVDAMRRFIDDEAVRSELLNAIDTDQPEVIRYELIETLVRAGDKRILPHLDNIIRTDTLPRGVRDVARIGSLKLI